MEGMNQTEAQHIRKCIYRNVTSKPPVQLLYTNKNVFKNVSFPIVNLAPVMKHNSAMEQIHF
jgi:hypothetical protein